MLTNEQRRQLIAFIANYTHAIRKATNASREQAEWMVQLGAATLLGAVFQVPQPTDDTIDSIDVFIVGMVEAAIAHEYGSTDVASVH